MGSTSSPALMAEVTKIVSSQTTGELQLRPGRSIFQTTFSVSLQVSGRAGSSPTSPAFGPRNCAHYAPTGAGAASASSRA
ncbi:MAG: hypothetical protein OXG35_20350, partial [Acidobacteria bacterium]|nr:hypothetical protein [Acidobacteriota bacterium]